MKGTDLGTLRDALTHFRGAVLAQAGQVEQAAVSPATQRQVQAEGWEQPAWAAVDRFRSESRLLEAGEPVLRRILDGWTGPDLSAVAAVDLDDRELEREMHQAREAFVSAAAVCAVEYACFGNVYPRRLDNGSEWRRVAPGSWPAQARELVPAAREALDRWGLAWLAAASMVEGAGFLPARGRR